MCNVGLADLSGRGGVSEEKALAFVRDALGSIWSLEVLLVLQQDQGRSWDEPELEREVRGSPQIVREALAVLSRVRVASSTDGPWQYVPASPELAALVAEVAQLQALKPLLVSKAIFASSNDRVRAFAEVRQNTHAPAIIVYGLCVLTSGLCAALLIRKYKRTPDRLLLWSFLYFLFLSLNSVLVFLDYILPAQYNLSLSSCLCITGCCRRAAIWLYLGATLTMLLFLYGMITAGFLVVGLYFLKFWRATQDVLFAAFALAAALLALNQGLIAISAIPEHEQAWLYLLRLAAFIMIAIAILIKNMEPGRN